ncbi:hypothetical protein [Streptomyces sp. NPDC002588]|uniref:hypothetical protein n=1 Tax=Streptomyces sp. NPDC002588 TaxID=3154419 RepID=UPI00331CB047
MDVRRRQARPRTRHPVHRPRCPRRVGRRHGHHGTALPRRRRREPSHDRLQNGTYVGECAIEDDYVVIDDCPTVAVGAGQVFLRSKDDIAGHTSNWVIGFDLATGNTTQKFESGPDSLLVPVEMSGDRLLALRESQDRISPSALVELDPETGKETPFFYFNLPLEAETFTSTDFTDVLVHSGLLFFGAKSVTGPVKDQPRWVYAVLGIESGAATKGP